MKTYELYFGEGTPSLKFEADMNIEKIRKLIAKKQVIISTNDKMVIDFGKVLFVEEKSDKKNGGY